MSQKIASPTAVNSPTSAEDELESNAFPASVILEGNLVLPEGAKLPDRSGLDGSPCDVWHAVSLSSWS
ncbi:MAG: hypothetical protein ABL931_12205 [Usitatibacteraceae bacterium]